MNTTTIRAVFFDLDGTLLPMDQSVFLKEYLKRLAIFVAPHGIAPDKMVEATMSATEYMIRNDGSKYNKEVFWENFFRLVGEERDDLVDITDEFYLGKFKEVKDHVGTNPLARDIVRAAGQKGRKVVLATNPVFPMAAQLERISWIGLEESDFEFITSYDNSKYCKPNPDYYREICEKVGVAPEECLMIGNDERDDMKAASEAGMRCFLITDCRIMSDHFVWTGERGSFEQALHMLERL
ncbi:MAG: HAD family hydrolase [Ruminococcaceae bacterium]|nr:HAD family hydrolase [Oscillospiraceae bacterium]